MGQAGIVPEDLRFSPVMSQQVDNELYCKACTFDNSLACKDCGIDIDMFSPVLRSLHCFFDTQIESVVNFFFYINLILFFFNLILFCNTLFAFLIHKLNELRIFKLLILFFFFFARNRPISTHFVIMRAWREVLRLI